MEEWARKERKICLREEKVEKIIQGQEKAKKEEKKAELRGIKTENQARQFINKFRKKMIKIENNIGKNE